MKKLLFLFVSLLLAVSASAQNDHPTANWPYMYPDFMEGELLRANKDSNKGRFNIHLNLSALHYVDKNGKIKEADTWGVIGLIIGEDRLRCVAEGHGRIQGWKCSEGKQGQLSGCCKKGWSYGYHCIEQYHDQDFPI